MFNQRSVVLLTSVRTAFMRNSHKAYVHSYLEVSEVVNKFNRRQIENKLKFA